MNPKKISNYLLNDFKGILNKQKVKISDCGIDAEDFRVLSQLLFCEVIDKKKFREMIENKIVEYKNL